MNLNVELENNTMAYELFKKLAVIVDLLPCEKIGGFVGTQKVKLEIIFKDNFGVGELLIEGKFEPDTDSQGCFIWIDRCSAGSFDFNPLNGFKLLDLNKFRKDFKAIINK